MSQPPKPPLFLQRASYRQRRLRDAARLIPCIGVILWLLPLAWPVASQGEGESVGASGLLYIFGVWFLLILVSAILSSQMRPMKQDPHQGKGDGQ